MADSDSESNNSFDLQEIAEEHQTHIQEILERAKKIVPSYDKASLYRLYQRYYSVQNIFFNELQIIAKRLRGDLDEGNQGISGWINVGRKVQNARTKNPQNYNFLQDRELLRRAEQYARTKQVKPRTFNNNNNIHRNENHVENNKSYKNGSNIQYKEKDELKQKTNNSTIRNNQQESNKKKVKYAQKVQKNQTTPVQKSQKISNTNTTTQSSKYQQKKQQKVIETSVSNQKTTQTIKPQATKPKQTKYQQKKVTETTTTKPVQITKVQQKKVVQKQSVAQTKKVEAVTSNKTQNTKKYQPKQVNQTKDSLNKTQSQISQSSSKYQPDIDESFNSKLALQTWQKQRKIYGNDILAFIKPMGYPQKISYTRGADGNVKNVQVRVVAGSQQNIKIN